MDYTGYIYKNFTDKELSNFYMAPQCDELKENQYLVVLNNDEIVDKFILQNGKLNRVNFTVINSSFMGDIKPRNTEQELAFHMLKDSTSKIKVLTGRYGSGKSMAMIANAIEQLRKGKFDKIVYVRNNIGVRDTMELGSLPGLT